MHWRLQEQRLVQIHEHRKGICVDASATAIHVGLVFYSSWQFRI
jgi:hypothetical protein